MTKTDTQEWIERILAEHGEAFTKMYLKMKNDERLSGIKEFWDDTLLGPMYVDRNRQKIDLADFTVLFSSMEYRRIAFDEVGPWHISTVWLGMSGIPGHIFESMVFQNELSHREGVPEWNTPPYAYHESLDERRYRTEEEALIGHAELVRQAEAMLQVSEAIDPRAGA